LNKRFALTTVLSVVTILAAGQPALAQFGRGGAEWLTTGSDAQRSFSLPTDSKISADALQKPGFQFLWKVKLNNEGVQLNSLAPVSLIDRYIGYRGFRSLAFVGGSWNSIAAIDTDLNRIEWQTHLQGAGAPLQRLIQHPRRLAADWADGVVPRTAELGRPERARLRSLPLWQPLLPPPVGRAAGLVCVFRRLSMCSAAMARCTPSTCPTERSLSRQ
jgi:hypothetical protein